MNLDYLFDGILPDAAPADTEFSAWIEMVTECHDWYEQQCDERRATIAEYKQRIERGEDYPGVIQTMRQMIPRHEIEITAWDTLWRADPKQLAELMTTTDGAAAVRYWRNVLPHVEARPAYTRYLQQYSIPRMLGEITSAPPQESDHATD